VEYVLLIAGVVAAGATPVLAFVAYKVSKDRRRAKEARSRRKKKVQL
jgi:hypothetical protein